MELAAKPLRRHGGALSGGAHRSRDGGRLQAALARTWPAWRRADRAVIDLAGVEYISSVGLRVLMLASKQVKAQGGALAVRTFSRWCARSRGSAASTGPGGLPTLREAWQAVARRR